MEKHFDAAGSAAWHARRANCFNAADAPAMAACSANKTRTQLLAELASGVAPEFSDYVQERVLNRGHAIEDACRQIAEEIVGEEMAVYAGTLVVPGLSRRLGASFDGITFMEDTLWECKSLNDELRAALPHAGRDSHKLNDGKALPKDKRIQMEQQLMVSKAERTLFTAAAIDRNGAVTEERHAWYSSDPELRAQIVPGWAQLDRDLVDFTPATVVPKVVAEPVEALPAPFIQVTGELALQDNFKVFEARLRDFLDNKLIREPKTDEDFVNLDAQIKAMKQGREALKSAKAQMLAQVQPVDMANKAAEALDKLLQQNCKMAEDLLTAEKERRRGEIVAVGVNGLRNHIAELNKRLDKPYMPTVPADFGAAIRGLKSLASMEDKVAAELARTKIAASEIADRIEINLRHLAAEAGDFGALFPDIATIALKQADDFAAVVQFRVADHKAKEQKRADELAEQSRERIRKEEADRIARENAAAAAPAPVPAAAPAAPAFAAINSVAAPAPAVIAMPTRTAPPTTAPTLSLGKLGTRLGFNLTADFLRSIGFEPAGRERAAVLYHESSFGDICAALVRHIESLQAKAAA